MGRPKAELKVKVIEFANQTTDSAGDAYRIILHTQGTGLGDRIGNSIFLKSIQLNLVISCAQAQAAAHAVIRFTMLRYKGIYNTLVPWIAGTQSNAFTPIDHWFTQTAAEFRTVWDHRYSLNPYFSGQEKTFVVKKRWKVNKTIRWQNNTQANPDSNEYVLYTCDNLAVGGTLHPLFSMYFILRYYDS